MANKPIEHENVKEIVCPYCGYEFSDSWEFGDDSEREITCEACYKPFTSYREVEVTYSTERKKCENECNYIISKKMAINPYIDRGLNWTFWHCSICHDQQVMRGPVAKDGKPYVNPLPGGG